MDWFLGILLLLAGLGFAFVGYVFFFRWRLIIQWIQKRKYGKTAEPRQQEKTAARIVGVLVFLIGAYYTFYALYLLSLKLA
ncbi:MAG: hypothetical protein V1761_02820 [bacterium]